MNLGFYTVRRGDTLTRIAKQHGTTPEKIADLNHLSNLNLIRIGQKLIIPSPTSTAAKAPPPPSTSVLDDAGELWLTFVDAVNKPIKGLKVFIVGLEKEFEGLTDTRGKIPVLPVIRHDTPVTISVEKAGGGSKEVAKFNATKSVQSVVLTSPKVKVHSALQPHEEKTQKDPPPPHPPHAPGTVIDTHSPAGHPVKQVVLECPNKENLCLGVNYKYRKIIIAASKRSGLGPQTIAAIIDAEAGKTTRKTAVPVLDIKGDPVQDESGVPIMRTLMERGAWDEKSSNPRSTARGMTQFIDGTWISLALCPGTFLNDRAREKGWITSTTEKGKTKVAFCLSSGKLLTAQKGLSLQRRLCRMTKETVASDSNLQELLDLRFDAESSIFSAVEYGIQNLNNLQMNTHELNEGEKAKIIYLCHHLGSPDDSQFIANTMSPTKARYLLERQIRKKGAEKKAMNAGGDYLKAHREWLGAYVDRNIRLVNFMCDRSSADNVRDLIAITEVIRKK